MIPEKYLTRLIQRALNEDIGDGDHTSLACIPPDANGKAQIIIKEKGIICGIEVAEKVFKICSQDINVHKLFNDGMSVMLGDVIMEVEGPQIKILEAERTALNFMQRMSGIATETNKYTQKIKNFSTRLLDTRKTSPGQRLIEKYAVKIGGGQNHRIGLFDMIMLKDNHIDFAGGIEKAINLANDYLKRNNKKLEIVIEVRSFRELEEVLKTGNINRIMLDNFSVKDTKKAQSLIDNKFETESSGGISLDNIKDYAQTGVNYISVGAITHKVQSLDMSLKAV